MSFVRSKLPIEIFSVIRCFTLRVSLVCLATCMCCARCRTSSRARSGDEGRVLSGERAPEPLPL